MSTLSVNMLTLGVLMLGVTMSSLTIHRLTLRVVLLRVAVSTLFVHMLTLSYLALRLDTLWVTISFLSVHLSALKVVTLRVTITTLIVHMWTLRVVTPGVAISFLSGHMLTIRVLILRVIMLTFSVHMFTLRVLPGAWRFLHRESSSASSWVTSIEECSTSKQLRKASGQRWCDEASVKEVPTSDLHVTIQTAISDTHIRKHNMKICIKQQKASQFSKLVFLILRHSFLTYEDW